MLVHYGSETRATPPGLPADGVAALQEVIHQLAGGVVHLDVERFDAAGQVVVHHHGRYGDEQTDGGGDQRFGDAAGDRAQTGATPSGTLGIA